MSSLSFCIENGDYIKTFIKFSKRNDDTLLLSEDSIKPFAARNGRFDVNTSLLVKVLNIGLAISQSLLKP